MHHIIFSHIRIICSGCSIPVGVGLQHRGRHCHIVPFQRPPNRYRHSTAPKFLFSDHRTATTAALHRSSLSAAAQKQHQPRHSGPLSLNASSHRHREWKGRRRITDYRCIDHHLHNGVQSQASSLQTVGPEMPSRMQALQ